MIAKIRSEHLARPAYIYLRQSTLGQVEFNRESTERQYSLVDRAAALGWDRSQIKVLDADLGLSGTSLEGRSDFLRLMAFVSMGSAGAVFALEASRFSRSQADWHKLIDVCALTDTLIIDLDGTYDPNDFNDRVLLGFKGTWSHTELHGMKLRLQGAKLSKAAKGELRCQPPAGYVYDEAGHLMFDPDESVVACLKLVFSKFREVGSAFAVVKYFAINNFLVPSRTRQSGPNLGFLSWSPLSGCRMLSILKNPTYAGAYVYGRQQVKKKIVDGVILKFRHSESNPQNWAILIKDAHCTYLTWDEFMDNRQQLSRNRFDYDCDGRRGVARKGSALLQGLIICGKCGTRMRPYYNRKPSQPPNYLCGNRAKDSEKMTCWVVPIGNVDRAVETHLLEAVSKENLDLSLAVLLQIENGIKEDDKQWKLRLERSRTDTERARRQFEHVEPENRLVARTLEKKWNNALAHQDELEQKFKDHLAIRPLTFSPQERCDVLQLSKDFARIWHAVTTTQQERKELLALLVKQVAVTPITIPTPRSKIDILWQSGAKTTVFANRPRSPRPTKTPPAVIEKIRSLSTDLNDDEIANNLNSQGLRSGLGNTFTRSSVLNIRTTYCRERPTPGSSKDDSEASLILSTSDAALKLGVSIQTISYWRMIGAFPSVRKFRGKWWYNVDDRNIDKIRNRIRSHQRRFQNQE